MRKNIFIVFLLLVTMSYSQENKIIKGRKLFEDNAYVDAIKIYEKVANKGFESVELLQNLGDCYYFNGQYVEANKWYSKLFSLGDKIEDEYYYRFAQTLKSIGDYNKSAEMIDSFSKAETNQIRTKLLAEDKDYLERIKANSGRYLVEPSAVSSPFSDFGPAFFGNSLVFSSNKERLSFFRKVDKWTNNNFNSLYVAKLDSSKHMPLNEGQKIKMSSSIKFHTSSAVFTKDGKTMYFTGNASKSKGDSKKESFLLKIYKAELIENKWSNIQELSINGNEYNTAHPALSQDEKVLFFVSDRKGGVGDSDIYKVNISETGDFGQPENLGSLINTEGTETFPFISGSNELYFASDGHPGLGGLDIFACPYEDNKYSTVYNVGEPINSCFDDFSFIINENDFGFFSSNRTEGRGYDDIYAFKEFKKLKYQTYLNISGVVNNEITNKVLSGITVELYDSGLKKIGETKTDNDGKYEFNAKKEPRYRIRFSDHDYVTKEIIAIGKEITKSGISPILLQEKNVPIKNGTDLAKVLHANTVYFDFDKKELKREAAVDLQKIVELLQTYPSIEIVIRSYTDSRGDKNYNQRLSECRVQAIIDHLVNSGIDASRLSGKGYGESQLVNGCQDGVKCSEAEHQRNRRSEFIIVSM
jgi:outer membrane protein OmpA-like peptidoglycan-associated protein/tetratricopeptide (TPR) repeat protein